MAIVIREADLEGDRAELIRFLAENLTAESDAGRFDWLYRQNPFGQARAWLAADDLNRTVGMAAAFPRRFWVSGKHELAWVLGDFCFSKEHRSLGPALQLQKASLASLIDKGGVCYDFPSQNMMAIYRRLGVPVLAQSIRFAKLIRVDDKVQRFVKHPSLARSMAFVGNCALKCRQLVHPLPLGIEVSQHEGAFGDEFDAIDCHATATGTVQVARTADYLNWRYRRHPHKQYCAVVARRRSRLLGYGIVETGGSHVTLADLCVTEEGRALPGILGYIERVLRKMNVCSISFPMLENCRFIPHLRRAGFYPREAVPVIAYGDRITGQSPSFLSEAKNWMLLYGDRES